MTSGTAQATAAAETNEPFEAKRGDVGRRPNLTDVVSAEITKGLSVRSTYWTLLATIVVSVGLGALISWGTIAGYDNMPAEARATIEPTAYSLSGAFFGQIALAVLGVIVITSEYGTGLIRTSLTAVPKRWQMMVAKLVVFGAAATAVGLVVSFAAFFAGQAIFGTKDLAVDLSQAGVQRAVIGTGLYLGVVGLFALGIGGILRHTAGAVTTVLGFMLLPTMLGALLPQWWQDNVVRYLPFNAGGQIMSVTVPPGSLAPWTGFAILCAWAAVALILAIVLLEKRDA
jgi:ABC-type transport system involved in multi-copper enzyme maturation permease subunit